MWSGATMSLKFAPVRLAPRKFASRRSLLVRSQFCGMKNCTNNWLQAYRFHNTMLLYTHEQLATTRVSYKHSELFRNGGDYWDNFAWKLKEKLLLKHKKENRSACPAFHIIP